MEEGNGKPPHINCTIPCDWSCAIGPAKVGRIIAQKDSGKLDVTNNMQEWALDYFKYELCYFNQAHLKHPMQ